MTTTRRLRRLERGLAIALLLGGLHAIGCAEAADEEIAATEVGSEATAPTEAGADEPAHVEEAADETTRADEGRPEAARAAAGTENAARAEMDRGWDAFIAGLQDARTSLVDPAHLPPEPTDRNLAEGHRYLLGHLGRLIEAEMRLDPRFPEFHRSMDMLRKHTGENPDAAYLKAPIDATGTFRVRGRAADVTEWKTSERTGIYPKAPRLVTFQTITGVPGNTGRLEEMRQCLTATLDFVNSFDLEVDDQGRFEILIAPERPEGHEGNFLASKKAMPCEAQGTTVTHEANFLAVREIYADWQNEWPLELEITRLDAVGENRPPVTAAWMSEKLETIARTTTNHIRFWSLLQHVALEVRADVNGDGRRNLPVNGVNDAEPPFTAGGAAGSQQLYASGVFELPPGQALVLRVETPVEPHYLGFQLNNFWMEGPDQQNYVSSLTGHQNPKGPDGARTYVIAHEDPGVQGWVATTGLEKGFHTFRFVYRENPTEEQLPTLEATLVPVAELMDVLPEGTTRVTPDMRRREVGVRQKHIKRRWRAY